MTRENSSRKQNFGSIAAKFSMFEGTPSLVITPSMGGVGLFSMPKMQKKMVEVYDDETKASSILNVMVGRDKLNLCETAHRVRSGTAIKSNRHNRFAPASSSSKRECKQPVALLSDDPTSDDRTHINNLKAAKERHYQRRLPIRSTGQRRPAGRSLSPAMRTA
jgi:hypothetical protein